MAKSKRKPTRKTLTFTVTVSVRREVTAAQARQEVRTRVNSLCAHYTWFGERCAEESDVRVSAVRTAK